LCFIKRRCQCLRLFVLRAENTESFYKDTTANTVKQGCTNFPKVWQTLQISGCQNSDMKQVPYWGFTNIRRHPGKFSRYGDQAPRRCERLLLGYRHSFFVRFLWKNWKQYVPKTQSYIMLKHMYFVTVFFWNDYARIVSVWLVVFEYIILSNGATAPSRATSVSRLCCHTQWDSSGRVIRPTHRPLLTQHTTLTRDRHPCLRRDSNPQSQ
jgi:hypothetical protein